MEVLFASKPVKLIVAPVPAQTAASCDAPDKVGGAFTVTVALFPLCGALPHALVKPTELIVIPESWTSQSANIKCTCLCSGS